MPTKHRRHAITETPPVREALDELRLETGEDRVGMSELVILGAREKVRRLRAEREDTAALRKRLADRIRNRTPLGDPDAAGAARERWSGR